MNRIRDDPATIQVRRKTRERLKRVGIKGETYDDVVNRLLDERDARRAEKRHLARQRNEPDTTREEEDE